MPTIIKDLLKEENSYRMRKCRRIFGRMARARMIRMARTVTKDPKKLRELIKTNPIHVS